MDRNKIVCKSLLREEKGFTLMEILIAGTILVIVIALATVMFTKAEQMNQGIRYESQVSNVVDGMFNEILYGNNALNIQGLWNANYLSLASSIENPPPSLTFESTSVDTNNLVYTIITPSITPSSSTQYETVYYEIAPGLNSTSGLPSSTGTDLTLWQWNGSHWQSLDFNKKIILQPGSGFQYYNYEGQNLNNMGLTDTNFTDTATYVQIILIAKSNDPALQSMPPVYYETSVRIKNKPSF